MNCCNQNCNQGRACPQRKPKKAGFLFALVVVAAFACAVTITKAHAQTAQEATCLSAQSVAVATLNARKAGATFEVAMNLLREQKIYSGPIVRAVKTAFKVPFSTSASYLEILVWGECMEAARK